MKMTKFIYDSLFIIGIGTVLYGLACIYLPLFFLGLGAVLIFLSALAALHKG